MAADCGTNCADFYAEVFPNRFLAPCNSIWENPFLINNAILERDIMGDMKWGCNHWGICFDVFPAH